jgi:hypothetical protein
VSLASLVGTARGRLRLRAELVLLLREPLAVALLLGLLGFCFWLGLVAGSARGEVEDLQADLRRQRGEIVARGGPDAAAEAIDLDRSLALLRRDRDLGTLTGGPDAVAGALASLPGAVLATALGALAVGREFERGTWQHVLGGAASRQAALAAKVAAGLVTMGALLVIGAILGLLGSAVGQAIAGGLALGPIPPHLPMKAAALAASWAWWLALGVAGAFVAARAAWGWALACALILLDALATMNLPSWQLLLMTTRGASVASLWRPVVPGMAHLARSAIWWEALPGPLEPPGAAVATLAAAAVACLVLDRSFIRRVPISWRS